MVLLSLLGDESTLALIAKTASVHIVSGGRKREAPKGGMVHMGVNEDSISF